VRGMMTPLRLHRIGRTMLVSGAPLFFVGAWLSAEWLLWRPVLLGWWRLIGFDGVCFCTDCLRRFAPPWWPIERPDHLFVPFGGGWAENWARLAIFAYGFLTAAIGLSLMQAVARRVSSGRCWWCGYDKTASGERCPECGRFGADEDDSADNSI
jgi:hypothetical protein